MNDLDKIGNTFFLFGLEKDLDDIPPPPPPPPPPDLLPGRIWTIVMAIVGVIIGAVTAVLLRIGFVSLGGLTETNTVGYIMLGLIDGVIFGIASSLIYNRMVSNSKEIKAFREAFPSSKELPYDYLTYYFIHRKFELLMKYLDDNFVKK